MDEARGGGCCELHGISSRSQQHHLSSYPLRIPIAFQCSSVCSALPSLTPQQRHRRCRHRCREGSLSPEPLPWGAEAESDSGVSARERTPSQDRRTPAREAGKPHRSLLSGPRRTALQLRY